jgi:hypothetical protein
MGETIKIFDFHNDYQNSFLETLSKDLSGYDDYSPYEKYEHFFPIELNNFGYHCDNFDIKNDKKNILFSGCSITAGMGIDFKDTWAYRLNQEFGCDKFLTLAAPARSIKHISDEIYRYIEKFGTPETIAILFPPVHRGRIITSGIDNAAKVRSLQIEEETVEKAKKILENKKYEWINANYYLKQYYDFCRRDSTTYDAIRIIKNLEIFLKSLGTRFLWSTWDPELAETIFNAKNKGVELFNNYIYWETIDLNNFLKENILTPEGEKEETWLQALDSPYPHPGVIEQMFFFNLFKKRF